MTTESDVFVDRVVVVGVNVNLDGDGDLDINGNPKPFKWTASADEILGKIARFAQRTLQAHGGS